MRRFFFCKISTNYHDSDFFSSHVNQTKLYLVSCIQLVKTYGKSHFFTLKISKHFKREKKLNKRLQKNVSLLYIYIFIKLYKIKTQLKTCNISNKINSLTIHKLSSYFLFLIVNIVTLNKIKKKLNQNK